MVTVISGFYRRPARLLVTHGEGLSHPGHRVDWERLLTTRRLARPTFVERAAQRYQRDWDRILYSPHFRRLAGKTQVFPLPLDDHIHSRRAQPREVATVGVRSGPWSAPHPGSTPEGHRSTRHRRLRRGRVPSHDMGNPPFGTSARVAIQELSSAIARRPHGFARCRKPSVMTCSRSRGTPWRCGSRPGRTDSLSPVRPGSELRHAGALVKYRGVGDSHGKPDTRKSSTPSMASTLPSSSSTPRPRTRSVFEDLDAHAPGCAIRSHSSRARRTTIAYQIIDLEDGLRLHHVSQAELLELLRPLCELIRAARRSCRRSDREAMLDLASRLRSIAINTLIHEVADRVRARAR